MDPNQNVPSEQDWTIEEREEFFASQDAITFSLDGVPHQPPIEWSTSAWNGPIQRLSSDDPFGDLERLFSPGIHVTSIVPPEQGWPMAFYCPICKETVFLLSLYSEMPKEGGYYKMDDTCASEEHGYRHNMTMALPRHPIPFNIKDNL